MPKKTAMHVVGVTSIQPEIEAMTQIIREAAYERFLARGSEPGDAVEDWLLAEASIVYRPEIRLTEEPGTIAADFHLADVSPEQIQVITDGKFVLVLTGESSPQWFGIVEFPLEIDRDTLHAEYDQGTLRIVGSAGTAAGTLQMTA